MTFIDKIQVAERLHHGQRVALELGCELRKRHGDAIGIDRLDYPGVDLVGGVFKILRSLPVACAQSVHAYHFLST